MTTSSARNNFDLEGFPELQKRLKGLNNKVARRDVVRILRKGAPPIKREMKKLAPKRTGRLEKAISTRRGRRGRSLGEVVLIGPRLGSRGVPYAHLVELGTKSGKYRTRKGGFSVITKGGSMIRTPEINHPGVKGQFFIDRAFESKSKESAEKIQKYLIKLIES